MPKKRCQNSGHWIFTRIGQQRACNSDLYTNTHTPWEEEESRGENHLECHKWIFHKALAWLSRTHTHQHSHKWRHYGTKVRNNKKSQNRISRVSSLYIELSALRKTSYSFYSVRRAVDAIVIGFSRVHMNDEWARGAHVSLVVAVCHSGQCECYVFSENVNRWYERTYYLEWYNG